jgi:lipopolysaccharide assembly outer membrane protein LptD (OstA)
VSRRLRRKAVCLLSAAALIVCRFCLPAQAGFGGFDSLHAGSLQSNARTGDFTIPTPFTASREDITISGDRASGNASSQLVTIDGHIIVHMKRSVSVTGQAAGSEQGPSTMTCDHLEIDAQSRHYHATGNVHYVQKERSMTADVADFDEASRRMRLEGHVAIAGAGKSNVAGGFDSLKTATIGSDSSTGDFTIPGSFQATRQGVDISGDRAHGNTRSNKVSVIGDVVVKVLKRSGMLTCDRMEIDGARRLYHAIGNVRYIEPSRDLAADSADMNEATHMLHMKGHVRVTDTHNEKP